MVYVLSFSYFFKIIFYQMFNSSGTLLGQPGLPGLPEIFLYPSQPKKKHWRKLPLLLLFSTFF